MLVMNDLTAEKFSFHWRVSALSMRLPAWRVVREHLCRKYNVVICMYCCWRGKEVIQQLDLPYLKGKQMLNRGVKKD